jgi:hypothetical protein
MWLLGSTPMWVTEPGPIVTGGSDPTLTVGVPDKVTLGSELTLTLGVLPIFTVGALTTFTFCVELLLVWPFPFPCAAHRVAVAKMLAATIMNVVWSFISLSSFF